ncbi:serine hydrolase [Streptomyces sp. ACA25]|uniref:serine hydrolase n=1 Tax=Streptomyces sp. ACA25 TaxID=3022596 RepID=UPI002307B9C0|nr:serine hydrolase [Streptomyces sp. ACA25]MDB1089000.1 serine hydrolase [Streptomyces sp. ACA25]
MTPPIPPRLSRRGAPVVLVNAALATTLLAVTASGDSVRVPAQARGTEVTVHTEDPAPEVREGIRRAHTGQPVPPERRPARTPGPDAELAAALAPLTAAHGVRLSVAVFEPGTGRSAGFGSGTFDTASIVKVNVLAVLLLQAQDAGRELTDQEKEHASAAIRFSDNDATHELWAAIGGEHGFDAGNARLGLTSTRGGPDGHWGLTQTTTDDQITLLRAVFGTDSALDPASRAILRALMSEVAEDQRWGVSAASDGPVALKNGWLPRSHTELWDVNSIGRVTVAGRTYLLAVISDGHSTHAEGVAAVEEAARAAVAVIRSGSAV